MGKRRAPKTKNKKTDGAVTKVIFVDLITLQLIITITLLGAKFESTA